MFFFFFYYPFSGHTNKLELKHSLTGRKFIMFVEIGPPDFQERVPLCWCSVFSEVSLNQSLIYKSLMLEPVL